jgi:hypothetical protein
VRISFVGAAMLRTFAFFVTVFLTACTGAQLEYQSDAFNRAIAISSNQHLLLNAVRSSLDLPLSFSKFVKYTGKENISGSFAPKLPFGRDASLSFDLAPQLAWSPGIQAVEYNDVNIGTAIEKINSSISYADYDRYLRAGDGSRFLATLLVEFYEVHKDVFDAMLSEARKICRGPHNLDEQRSCDYWENLRAQCKDPEPAVLDDGQTYIIYYNEASTRCSLLQFQSFLQLFRLVNVYTDMVMDEKAVIGKDENNKDIKSGLRLPKHTIFKQKTCKIDMMLLTKS